MEPEAIGVLVLFGRAVLRISIDPVDRDGTAATAGRSNGAKVSTAADVCAPRLVEATAPPGNVAWAGIVSAGAAAKATGSTGCTIGDSGAWSRYSAGKSMTIDGRCLNAFSLDVDLDTISP